MSNPITERRSTPYSKNGSSSASVETGSELMISLDDPVDPSDQSFLYQVFASTRATEMATSGWSAEQQQSFLSMQYEAQRSSYLTQLPSAEYSIIRCHGIAAGRLIVDRTAEEIHIVDIALLPEFRNLGIGSSLMGEMMEEASLAGKRVRLYVERFNPALRWYERLGFRVLSTGPIYLEMVWRSGSDAGCRGQQRMTSEADSGAAYVDSSD